MAKSITFSVKLNVDGKEQLVAATNDVKHLRGVVQSMDKPMQGMLKQFNTCSFALNNISIAAKDFASSWNSLTSESRTFSQAMAAANTMAGKSGDDFVHLKEQVAELAKEIPMARDLLANGLYQTISNGVPEDNWLTYLEQSAKASVGGLANLEEVVKVTSTMIKNYGLAWSDAGLIQDKIQMTAVNGVTSFEQLAQALPRVAANASTLGVTVDELMASFATLTGVSGNTAEVSTQLAAIFTALIKPSSEARKMAQAMGIEFNAASIKAAGGMKNFLTQLDADVKRYAASSGMLEQEVYGKLFGSAESLRAITPLTGKLADKFEENVDVMADSAGTIDEAFKTMADTGSAQLQKLNNRLGEYTDILQNSIGNVTPYVNFVSQMTVTAASVGTLSAPIAKVAARIRNLITEQEAFAIVSKRVMAIVTGCNNGLAGAAASATAAKVAIRGLMLATGVGAAITVLSLAINALCGSMDEVTEKTEELQEAEQAYRSTAAQTQVSLTEETKRLRDLISAKRDTTAAVEDLNTKYGEVFGNHKTAAEWYDTLTKKSQIYARQMGYEAQMKLLSTQLAEKEIQLQENFDKRRELWKSGGARQTTTSVVGTSVTGGYQTATYQEDTAAYTALKDEAKGLIPSIAELRKKIDVAAGKMAGIATQLKVPAATTTTTTETAAATATTTPKATATTTEKEKPLEGSLGWYEAELRRIKGEIEATADKGVAQAKQGEYEALEKKYNELKIAIGIEKPDTEEAKTIVEQLQDSLQEAQKQFDNTDVHDIEAKVKAQAKVDEIQGQINKATRGKLTIEADTEPAYVVQGSVADKRQSYSNAQAKASRIQQDFEIGLIGKDEVQRQVDALNKELESLGAGLKPIKVKIDTDDATRNIGSLSSVSITSFDSVRQNLQALQELPNSTAKGFAAAGDAALMLGSALQQLGSDSEAAKAGMVLAAIGQIVLSFAQALSSCKTWVEWLAFGIAGTAQMISLVATVSGFAKGGIVGGSSTSGDKIPIRVNSGEMVLTKTQQARLFAIANGEERPRMAVPDYSLPHLSLNMEMLGHLNRQGTDAQTVNFRIEGRNLVGALANETRVNSRSGKRANIKI